LDNNGDKEMMRNQVIAIILMTVVVFVWINWFMPKPSPRREGVPRQAQPREAPREEDGAPQATAETDAAAQPSAPLLGLPEIPSIADPSEEEVTLSNECLELVFTRIGGRLKRASLVLGDNGEDSVQLVPASPRADTETIYPMGLRFPAEDAYGDELDRRRFDADVDPAGNAVTFSLALPDDVIIRKRFSLGARPFVVDVAIECENLGAESHVVGMDQTPAYVLNWGPSVAFGDKKKGRYAPKKVLAWRKDGLVDEVAATKVPSPPQRGAFAKVVEGPEWLAFKSTYFVVAVKPEFEAAQAWARAAAANCRFGLSVPRFRVEPRAKQANAFSLYMGPCEQKTLAAAWDSLPEVRRFFSMFKSMDWFAKLLLGTMNWFYAHIIPNYGLAIIFLTVVVRLGMYPLTLKSMRSMKRMQMLGPEMEQLKAKFGDNPQELNKKMMEMYKERGVNPLGGCFPIALQMPVFITLYRMLWQAYELRGAPFLLWITDLSEPDRLFHMPWMEQVPFVGATFEYFNLLPILMGLSMVLNQKLMPTSAAVQNPQQKMMMTIMPVFFCFICYNMAAGLNLYILTSTVLGMVQQKFTRVHDSDLTAKKKKTVGKRQHFYTAAKARQRQLARMAKQGKKRKPR